MFGEPIFFASRHARAGGAQVFSEFVASFGLLVVIWGCSRLNASNVAFAVAAYITAAYWFTASTSFANPAVTLARSASDTFAGIRPADAPAFIAAQLGGAGAATSLFRELARVKAAGLPVREEMGVNCCHANQDKFWVEDPDGVDWEVYVLNHDLEESTLRATDVTSAPAAKGLAVVQAGGGCCGSSA